MRIKMLKIFCCNINKDTWIALFGGSIMILLSLAMNMFPNDPIAAFILRDILMIFIVGFLFPLYYILIVKKQKISVLGLSSNKWKSSLLINIILAVALLLMFISRSNTDIKISKEHFYAITYIFVAGIFEILFIYGFLRYKFEQSFGIIPAIFLTAVFYSLHHAGFQPEFIKLFFVGILYTSVFYITQNLLSIFPFFWGVGAIWDVLINSTAGNQIANFESFIISILLSIAMVISGICIFKKASK